MNTVSLTGNAGRDPEARYFESGSSVATFTMALYEGRDKDPSWVEVQAWNKTAEIATDRVRKGMRVGVEGRLKQETWTDRNTGENRSKLVVVANRVEVFERQPATAGGGAASVPPAGQAHAAYQAAGWNPPAPAPSDDGIPF